MVFHTSLLSSLRVDDPGSQGGNANNTSLQPSSSSSSSAVFTSPLLDDASGDDRMSQITRLHQKMRELKAVDEQLSAMKHDYANRMRVVAQGEARFLEKQKQTIDYLTKFRGYIQDADAKRSRAERKLEDERRAIAERSSECAALTARYAMLTKTLKSKLKRLEHHQQYREYLESVVSVAKLVYGDVEDMISRHKSLTATNSDLQARVTAIQQEVAALSLQRNAVRKAKQTELLVANSLLARLLKDLERETAACQVRHNSVR